LKNLSEEPWFRKMLINMAGKPLFKQFNKASKDIRKAQKTILKKTIASCSDTVFGREHHFGAIHTVDDYRKNVPIRDFEGHWPYIERMCNGEPDILFPGKALMYGTTSGTTNKPKYIPVSDNYFNYTYKEMSRLWLYTCLKDNPHMYDGKSLSAVAPETEGKLKDGTSYGSISGAVYRNIPGILKSTCSNPYPIIGIPDYILKYYGMMRFALPENITYIVCPSASNLFQFHNTIMNNSEDLIRDIHDGTLRKDVFNVIAASGRDEIKAALHPEPHKAKALESLIRKHGNELRPKHYWPNVALINIWKQGNFARLIKQIDGYYSDQTVLREFGYQASEARAGIVLGNNWDYSVLAAHMYHFEFIPEEERDSSNTPTLLAHELEIGKRYFILFSNTSGLYRYDINDLIEVIGMYNEFPLFKFIQKGEGTTSLTGEKITEAQIIQAIEDSAHIYNIDVKFYTMFCDLNEQQYRLYVEFASDTSEVKKTGFVPVVDAQLRTINREYEVKRGSGRLIIPVLVEMGKNSHGRFKEQMVYRGMARDGLYKDIYLRTKPVHREILDSLAQ
jgi:GH3 auxin-responsive promoter